MRIVLFDLDHTLFNATSELHEGVQELLSILQRLGIQVAGISTRDHRVIIQLQQVGIRNFFTQILCIDQHETPKEPAGVHHVLSRLGGKPHQAVLVSHAHADILLGKDVGVYKTIGVSHGNDQKSAAPLFDAGADHVVSDIPSILDVIE
ncbi:MAG TPA: HAD hydrolase-like protein [Candidatus Saccharimonadales bacterium]|nr:HAD hydrolase-like protein [Candidatus Saccharimonadales bacterium]